MRLRAWRSLGQNNYLPMKLLAIRKNSLRLLREPMCESPSMRCQETLTMTRDLVIWSTISRVCKSDWETTVRFLRSSKLLILKNLRFNEFQQRIAEQVRIVAIIKAERHFLKVGFQMLGTQPVPCPHDTSLKKRESRFNPVRGHVSVHVDALRVVDGLVFDSPLFSLSNRHRVGGEFLRHNHVHIIADVFPDVLCQRSRCRILGMEEPQFPITLLDSDYDLFGFLASVDALPSLLAAHVSLIDLHNAIQRFRIDLLHRGAYPVTEIPRRLVRHAQSPLDLISAHALAGLAEQVDAEKPLPERKMGIVKDRASRP